MRLLFYTFLGAVAFSLVASFAGAQALEGIDFDPLGDPLASSTPASTTKEYIPHELIALTPDAEISVLKSRQDQLDLLLSYYAQRLDTALASCK